MKHFVFYLLLGTAGSATISTWEATGRAEIV